MHTGNRLEYLCRKFGVSQAMLIDHVVKHRGELSATAAHGWLKTGLISTDNLMLLATLFGTTFESLYSGGPEFDVLDDRGVRWLKSEVHISRRIAPGEPSEVIAQAEREYQKEHPEWVNPNQETAQSVAKRYAGWDVPRQAITASAGAFQLEPDRRVEATPVSKVNQSPKAMEIGWFYDNLPSDEHRKWVRSQVMTAMLAESVVTLHALTAAQFPILSGHEQPEPPGAPKKPPIRKKSSPPG